MRQDYRHSLRKQYRHNPKTYCGFFEHEYDVPVKDEQWKETADDVDRCLKTFYESGHFETFRTMPPADYLEVERFSSFYVDGYELRIKLDCAVRDEGKIVIWDWKTGKKASDAGLSFQMGCYAAYTQKAYRVELDRVLTRRFDLYRGEVYEHTVNQSSLDEILTYARGSIADMVALLDDPVENTADEERFTKVERPEICLRCNFLKVCQPDIKG
jgi:hypothetical protein